MTFDELEALQNEKKKDLVNQILRVAGLFAVLLLVVLSVGVFLYPYSVFNIFGSGDKFWDCWNHVQYHLTNTKDIEVFVKEVAGLGYEPAYDGVQIIGAYDEGLGLYTDVSGGIWVSVQTILSKAFWGTSAKANFITLGAWSIIAVATIGLVGILILAAYIVAYNIKDLILVIRHFFKRTGYVITDISQNAVQSIDSTVEKKEKTEEKKPTTTKKPRVKKTVSQATPEEKTEEDREAEEIAAKLNAYKEEIANEEQVAIEPVVSQDQTVTAKSLNDMSDDELNKLLGNK